MFSYKANKCINRFRLPMSDVLALRKWLLPSTVFTLNKLLMDYLGKP